MEGGFLLLHLVLHLQTFEAQKLHLWHACKKGDPISTSTSMQFAVCEIPASSIFQVRMGLPSAYSFQDGSQTSTLYFQL